MKNYFFFQLQRNNNYLSIYKKKNRFVDAIAKFREDIKSETDIETLKKSFADVLNACKLQSAKKESDLVNAVRFVFLFKFIASLKPIDNPDWQEPVDVQMANKVREHVDYILHEKENKNRSKNIKFFVKVLS